MLDRSLHRPSKGIQRGARKGSKKVSGWLRSRQGSGSASSPLFIFPPTIRAQGPARKGPLHSPPAQWTRLAWRHFHPHIKLTKVACQVQFSVCLSGHTGDPVIWGFCWLEPHCWQQHCGHLTGTHLSSCYIHHPWGAQGWCLLLKPHKCPAQNRADSVLHQRGTNKCRAASQKPIQQNLAWNQQVSGLNLTQTH